MTTSFFFHVVYIQCGNTKKVYMYTMYNAGFVEGHPSRIKKVLPRDYHPPLQVSTKNSAYSKNGLHL
jgi:hypothetical protein